jgi:transcription elongation GreA/GreB family factor
MSCTTQTRRNINEVGRGRGRGGRFARSQQGGRGRGGRGGRGNNRNRPQKTRNDSTYITLQDGQEIEYHASFHFAPTIYNKMKDTDKDRMQRERKEYNRTKSHHPDQSRQIQELQQQLSVVRSVQLPQPPTDHISVGHVSQISQVTEGTRFPRSTMFGGRNEQASNRQRPRT